MNSQKVMQSVDEQVYAANTTCHEVKDITKTTTVENNNEQQQELNQYSLYSKCKINSGYGIVGICVFKHKTSQKEAVAVFGGNCLEILDKTVENENNEQKPNFKDVPIRVHDACITSEVFHSLKCDCRHQLELALKYVSTEGGMVVYLHQEGRGIGLGDKIRAYELQETQGLNTVEANRVLGLPDDSREYFAVRDILNFFNISSIQLITNNPRKVTCLEKLGITVSKTIPCLVIPESEQMAKYMDTKRHLMDHSIPEDFATFQTE
ncbi:hypothetical protein ABK040_012281 [Willaertia magna]